MKCVTRKLLTYLDVRARQGFLPAQLRFFAQIIGAIPVLAEEVLREKQLASAPGDEAGNLGTNRGAMPARVPGNRGGIAQPQHSLFNLLRESREATARRAGAKEVGQSSNAHHALAPVA